MAELTERTFYEYLEANGVASSGDPVSTMTRLLDRTVAWLGYLETLVGNLRVEEWERRTRSEEGAVTYQLSTYVALLERAQDRAARHLAQFVKLGLEERLVRVTEAQGEAITRVILATLADLGLGDREDEARELAAGHLELVAAGKSPKGPA